MEELLNYLSQQKAAIFCEKQKLPICSLLQSQRLPDMGGFAGLFKIFCWGENRGQEISAQQDI